MIVVFFNWHGMTGDDAREQENLTKASHPFMWFFGSVNQYETYLRNVFRLDFDKEEEVRAFVGKSMLAINKINIEDIKC